MPRYIFQPDPVTTGGSETAVSFYLSLSGSNRSNDIFRVDADDIITSNVPNGIIVTAADGVVGTFAGPDDRNKLYLQVGNDSLSRTQITAVRASGSEAAGGNGGGAVSSVAGKTGAVVLDKADVDLGSVDNTSDASKPISTAAQTALDLKAPIASPTFTGTVTGVTKTHVGLSNVDNTSDANKPISSAATTALALKAPIASPTFTGTVAGITKSMVGLGNVDNVADASKAFSASQITSGTFPISLMPAGTTLTVRKSGGTWPARPTSRTDITVIWVGADPSPSIVASGTTGMIDNVDERKII